MEAHKILTIGELMEVKVNNDFIKTKLQELLPGNQFTVFHPTERGLLARLEEGDTYKLQFYRENGVFSFDARLHSRFIINDIWLCLFEATTRVVRTQRRRSYRLPIVLDARLSPQDEEQKTNARPIKAKTVDLSEHGAMLTCFTPLQPDTTVRMELKLSPAETMTLDCSVLRCENPSGRKDPYRIVMLFTHGFDQQRLRRYILRQQIAARKKMNEDV